MTLARLSRDEQSKLLDSVVARCRPNGDGRAGVVVFDLDGTLMDNRPRTSAILRELATAWSGREPSLAAKLASAKPDRLAYLLSDTLAKLGVTRTDLVGEAEIFWRDRFFTDRYLAFDVEVPGAAAFARACYDAGGCSSISRGAIFRSWVSDVCELARSRISDRRSRNGARAQTRRRHAGRSVQAHVGAVAHARRKRRRIFDNEPANCNVLGENISRAPLRSSSTRSGFPARPSSTRTFASSAIFSTWTRGETRIARARRLVRMQDGRHARRKRRRFANEPASERGARADRNAHRVRIERSRFGSAADAISRRRRPRSGVRGKRRRRLHDRDGASLARCARGCGRSHGERRRDRRASKRKRAALHDRPHADAHAHAAHEPRIHFAARLRNSRARRSLRPRVRDAGLGDVSRARAGIAPRALRRATRRRRAAFARRGHDERRRHAPSRSEHAQSGGRDARGTRCVRNREARPSSATAARSSFARSSI